MQQVKKVVNNFMKTKKDILIGILVGALAFVSLIVLQPLVYQYQHRAIAESIEEDPFLNSALYNEISEGSWHKGYTADFGKELKVFSGNLKTMLTGGNPGEANYQNLYGMMLWVGVKDPEEGALVEIANSYNITPLEAADLMNGSLGPVKRLLPGLGNNMTQGEILAAAAGFRREFNDVYEIYQLKQELMSSSQLSEIFSNGDLDDSGFDLVFDLSEIEKVLFDISTPVESVDLGSDDDTSVDDLGMEDTTYHEEGPLAPEISHAYYVLNLDEEGAAEEEELEPFDAKDLVEYIEEDVCPTEEDDPLADALDDYDEEIEEYFEENEPEPDADVEEVDVEKPEEEKTLEEKLIPEEPADWKKNDECDGLIFFSFDNIKNLAENGSLDVTNLSDPLATESYTEPVGAGGSAETPPTTESGISLTTESGIPLADAEFYICLDYSEKWEVYKSFVPDDPCFSCEFEKILAYMNKTISSSLLPNKLTGNLLESSLCKRELFDALSNININFHTVFAPVETPPSNDAIFGKSVFEEWENFVNKNHPLLLENEDGEVRGHSMIEEYNNSRAAAWVEQNIDSDNISDYVSEISLMQQQMTMDAADEVEQYSLQSIAQDYAAYSEGILLEVGQMTEYFKAFVSHFEKISGEICKTIKTKETCQ
jgi:hypothetical protein